MFALFIALQVAIATPAPALVPVTEPSQRIAKILSTGDGRTQATAYKVKYVAEEYAVLRTFGLELEIQSLVIGKDHRAFDVLTGKDPKTGAKIDLWFDITSFFGKEFG